VHQRGTELRIYRTDSLETPVWTEIAASGTGFSFWSGAKNFWVWPTAKGFAYAVTDEGTMRFYDYATRTWTERHTPKENAIIGIAHSPGDVIGILTSPGGGFAGFTASQYYSRDYGQTWLDIPSSPYSVKVSAPRVLSDNTEVDDFYWNLERRPVQHRQGHAGHRDHHAFRRWRQDLDDGIHERQSRTDPAAARRGARSRGGEEGGKDQEEALIDRRQAFRQCPVDIYHNMYYAH
jgi:hypothetical protein